MDEDEESYVSVAGSVKQEPDVEADPDMQECRLYRGLVGSLQYLSSDRCDVQFETDACAKEMKQPTEGFMDTTETVASMHGRVMKPGTGCVPHEAFLRVWADNDWAGSFTDRKSQSSLEIEID